VTVCSALTHLLILGRFLVATAGVLLCKVTQIKIKENGHRYIGVNTGFNSLIRPMLYDAFHQIVNLSRLSEENVWKVDVVGPICESGDVFGRARDFPVTKEGDIILIATAGAYGKSMSSSYNIRAPAGDFLLKAPTPLT